MSEGEHRLRRIVSGGQTGVDRGALEAALAVAFPCGGWMPEGGYAEDGPIPPSYPLQPLEGADYAGRTLANARDSDGTLILCPGRPEGGTRLTVQRAREFNRPLLLLDAERHSAEAAAGQAAAFVREYRIGVLNVAGPRASGWPGAHAYAEACIGRLIALLGDNAPVGRRAP